MNLEKWTFVQVFLLDPRRLYVVKPLHKEIPHGAGLFELMERAAAPALLWETG